MGENVWAWIGIVFCISQSAMFSGLNLAFFSVGRLRLEVEVANGNPMAIQVLKKRQDSNFLLTTILWGNVGINVLLTLLSDSVLAGIGAFLFSTIIITFVGEIIPQAYFSRHAMKMAYYLSPVITFYQFVLYPVAKPIALLLDHCLGPEAILYFREADLREIIRKHIEADVTEIDRIEGQGALNFLDIDDIFVADEGVSVDPKSIIPLEMKGKELVFPEFTQVADDPFMQKIHGSQRKWVVFTDSTGEPHLALDADEFLRAALFEPDEVSILKYCLKPLILHDEKRPLGQVIASLKRERHKSGDIIIVDDIILLWGEQRKIITGSDILGRLLKGVKPDPGQRVKPAGEADKEA